MLLLGTAGHLKLGAETLHEAEIWVSTFRDLIRSFQDEEEEVSRPSITSRKSTIMMDLGVDEDEDHPVSPFKVVLPSLPDGKDGKEDGGGGGDMPGSPSASKSGNER